jgi:hypothetical protein
MKVVAAVKMAAATLDMAIQTLAIRFRHDQKPQATHACRLRIQHLPRQFLRLVPAEAAVAELRPVSISLNS